MTAHNRQHAPELASTVHSHRFAFPTPVVGNRYIVGVCQCGAESRGLAFESDAYQEARSFRGRKRLTGS